MVINSHDTNITEQNVLGTIGVDKTLLYISL